MVKGVWGGWNGRILGVNNGLEREQNGNNRAIKVSSLRLPRIQLIISRHQSGRLLRYKFARRGLSIIIRTATIIVRLHIKLGT